jgi:hypothetical protein
MAYCGEDNKAARELAATSLKTFFGPDRPYLKDQVNIYERLIEQWGGVPDHLKANFARDIKKDELNTGDAPEVDLSGGSGAIAQAIWNQLDADTLAERNTVRHECCCRTLVECRYTGGCGWIRHLAWGGILRWRLPNVRL